MTQPNVPETATATGPGPALLDWLLVVLMSALSGVIAVFGVFFLPVYRGSTPVPVAVLLVGVALAVIPRVTYRLTRSMPAALAPVAIWFVVTVGLYLTTNPLYVGAPVAWRGWQFALLIGVGSLTAAVSVGLVWGTHLTALDAARPPARRLGR